MLYGRAIKRQASLRELEMKMVRTKTKRTMHPFDLSFYPGPPLSLIPPISTQHITDKGTVEIACSTLSFCRPLSISTVGKEGTLGIVSASSFFLQGARQHA